MNLNEFQFVEAGINDLNAWITLSDKLFKDTNKDELQKDYHQMMSSEKHRNILVKNKQTFIGFIDISIRTEYVEGASSSPIGYIEGIYIEAQFRKMGIARKLIKLAEDWFVEKGCKEVGSDTWDWNKDAQEFHKRLGFKEEDVLVHFIKKIGA